MSSTQWGKVETVGDEGAVSGYTCGAWATACALLWACGGLCKGTQISASRRSVCAELHLRYGSEEARHLSRATPCV